MNRFEERRVQWVAACNTMEARIRKSCAISKATGWAELEADDFDMPLTSIDTGLKAGSSMNASIRLVKLRLVFRVSIEFCISLDRS